jgi:hypothetical protein
VSAPPPLEEERMEHLDFARAFQDGLRLEGPTGPIALRCRRIAELVVTSGKVVACDPFTGQDADAFRGEIAPGRYPVVLCLAGFLAEGDERVACALLRIGGGRCARWEVAASPSQASGELRAGYIFGYPVASGTGCFMDADAAGALTARLRKDTGYAEQLIAQMARAHAPGRAWLDMPIDGATGANLVAFSSGFGDGFYPSYWGRDADGRITGLVTDFQVLDNSFLCGQAVR